MSEPTADQQRRARIIAAILFAFVILLVGTLLVTGALTG
jgi:hypothetical protein